jgi:hypothetical protein
VIVPELNFEELSVQQLSPHMRGLTNYNREISNTSGVKIFRLPGIGELL